MYAGFPLPSDTPKSCSDCGATVLRECSGGHPIAVERLSGQFGQDYYAPNWKPPSYCAECSRAFPWTERRIQAAAEVVDALEGLSPGDRVELKALFPDLLRDGPRTQVAALKWRAAMTKAKDVGKTAIEQAVIGVATTGALKLLGLS